MDALELFPESYSDSRLRFLQDLEALRSHWPSARLETHALQGFPDLGIDWIRAEPERKEKLFILTTGEHGIEGFAGAALLRLFMEEFSGRIDPQDTGLLLVHAINPWGMQNYRKVTGNNVDLNRNFVMDGDFDEGVNPDSKTLQYLLTPAGPVTAAGAGAGFWMQVLRALLTVGVSRLSTAALLGQYHNPRGFFYGGREYEENTRVMMELYSQALEEYPQVVHVDIHTGYGPPGGLSIIIPPCDPIASAEAAAKFHYPLVQKINAEEFYEIHGDMQEYFYRLRESRFFGRTLFACGFEVGTLGDSLPARIRSLKAMVLENQLHWHGAQSREVERAVREEFRALYIPEDAGWRRATIAQGQQALEGVLRAYGLLRAARV